MLISSVIVGITFFTAGFAQSLTGFGSALIAMPILSRWLGLRVAAPLVALVGVILEIILVWRFRKSLDFRTVWKLLAASAPGVIIGIVALRKIDESITAPFMGVIVTGYAIYALLNFQLPKLENRMWVYLAGFLAGMLGGAYNTSGPPVILYGTCRSWSPERFKANLQGFFFVNSLFVFLGHAASENLTQPVISFMALASASTIAGVWSGLKLDKIINPSQFRKIVLWFLVGLGLQLMF